MVAKAIPNSSPIDFAEIPVQNFVAEILSSDPSRVTGMVHYNSTSNLLKYADNAAIQIIASKSYVDTAVAAVAPSLDWQSDVLNIQTDATLDPGASPATGARYILTDVGALHANFGSISGVANNDIVQYSGSAFVVAYDVSVQGEGAFTWNRNNNKMYQWDGSSWTARELGTTYTADVAMDLTGGAFSAKFDDATIGVNGSNELYIKASGVDTNELAADAVTGAKIDPAVFGSDFSFAGDELALDFSALLYTLTFDATTDWGSADGYGQYTITLDAATHGFGTDVAVKCIEEDDGTSYIVKPTRYEIVKASGDVNLVVSSRFAGRLVVERLA